MTAGERKCPVARDKLFLLLPDFTVDGRGPCYCPACATVEGLLAFYPRLRTSLHVQYVEFPRPRAAVSAELGPDNQGLPVLIIGPGTPASAVAGLDVREWQGKHFLLGPGDIGRYLARVYGIGEPH